MGLGKCAGGEHQPAAQHRVSVHCKSTDSGGVICGPILKVDSSVICGTTGRHGVYSSSSFTAKDTSCSDDALESGVHHSLGVAQSGGESKRETEQNVPMMSDSLPHCAN